MPVCSRLKLVRCLTAKYKAMKLFLSKLSAFALLPAALLVLPGCASASKDNQTIFVHFNKGVPGGTFVETYQIDARVVAVNPAARTVTFLAKDGSTNTFTAGPEVQDFSRFQMDDSVKVVIARELAMSLDKNDPPTATDIAAVVRAMPGILPGVLLAEPRQLTASVTAVDSQKREATLQLSDGRVATFKVRPDIDLTQVNTGAQCLIRTSAALAVLAEKP